jgi:hypothetical protein
MPDPITPEPNNNNGGNANPTPTGTDPKPTENGGQPANQNNNDQMIPKHRFDEVNTQLADLKKWKDEQEAAAKAKTEEDLKKRGEHEQLANQYKADADKAKTELQNERINNRIVAEAAKLGVTDLDAATKLIERGQIKVNDDGTITGVVEAVQSMVESKPYLKTSGVPQPTVGGGTNPAPGSDNNTPRFKHSQLQDSKFYRENEAAISEALRLGLVEDDLAPHN